MGRGAKKEEVEGGSGYREEKSMRGKSVRDMVGEEQGAGHDAVDYNEDSLRRDEGGMMRAHERQSQGIAPGALRKREAMVRKRKAKEEWKLHMQHVEAIRNTSNLSLGNTGGTMGGAMSPRTKMRGLAQGFRELDPHRCAS